MTTTGQERGCASIARRFAEIAAPLLLPGMLLASTSALAQRLAIDTNIGISGTATDNVELAPKGSEKSDLLLEISPRVALTGTGGDGRLRLSGNLDLGTAISSRLRGEDRVSFRPHGTLNATLEAIEKFFFIDGAITIQRNLESPFLGRPDGISPANTFTSTQVRLAPFIKGRLLGEIDYSLCSEHSSTDSGRTERLYSAHHSLAIERAPRPVGFVLSANRSVLDSERVGEPRRTTDIARLILRYSPAPQYAFGVRGGWERNDYVLSGEGRQFYGLDASWRPSERTNFEASWEDRYFGSGWNLSFTHRMPRLSFNVRYSRDITTTPEQFLTFPELANLIALLDAALTTRYPDPLERQRVIIDFLSRQQLPPTLLTPAIIYDERINLQTSASVGMVLLGKRNSLALSLFRSQTEGIAGTTTLLPAALANNVQKGSELSLTHNLTPTESLAATASWRRTDALGASSSQTAQKMLRVQLNSRFGPRSSGFVGARHQWIDSTVTHDARESALFFGLNHRF